MSDDSPELATHAELPKHFDPKEAEQRLYAAWEEAGCFQPSMDDNKPPFSIVIPPPNVTGSLHMGHAFNNTVMDLLCRFKRMRGYDVLWQPGTDHAGIATQMVVERKLASEGRKRSEMSREDFVDEVWDWKKESGGIIFEQLRRLGSSCDWSREKFTLGDPDDPSDKMAEAVTKAFVDMYNDGLIYRDKRLVNWDPHFQTAISDLEVENRDVDGHFWHFKYPLEGGETYTYVEKDEDGNVTLTEERDYISIATTRPETMLGDGAVAVHPDDERYAPIVGKMVRLPLADRLIPIITDEYPDMDFGSGAVKITGAHDFNDYEVAKRNAIPMYSLMGTKGEMIASEIMPEKYVGMDRFEARKAVVADIDAEGLLIAVEDKKIMQPFGDRSNVVIEPMLTDQWFVDAENLAGDAMAAVDRGHAAASPPPSPARGSMWDASENEPAQMDPGSSPGTASSEGQGATQFIPENWKKTYDHWMENIQPWCISRQLWWGHRVPAWLYKNTVTPNHSEGTDEKAYFACVNRLAGLVQKPLVAANVAELVEGLKDTAGYTFGEFRLMDVIVGFDDQDETCWDEDRVELHFEVPEESKKHFDGGVIEVWFERDPDVLDTWFSSGLWPFSTLGWPDDTDTLDKFYPTSVLVTAFDIIFFWVARMMMQGLHLMDEVPFHDVYIHALVLDEQGKKMSKSIGNTIDPLDLIDGVSIDELIEKRTRGLKNPEKAPQVAKATRKAYPDGFEAFGADALRFTLAAMAGQGRNIKLSVERVAGYRNFGTKLWNAARFAQMNGCRAGGGFNPKDVKFGLNRWAVERTAMAEKSITRAINDYRFSDAANSVYDFIWGTVCDWYIELAKPLFNADDASVVNETRETMAWVMDQSFKLLHPFMPFITEELWSLTDERDEFLMLSPWPELSLDPNNYQATIDVDLVIDVVSSLRSVRAEMNVPPSKRAPLIVFGGDNIHHQTLSLYEPVLRRLARIDSLVYSNDIPKNSLQTVVDGVTYAIPLDGLIDIEAEQKRLDAAMEKVDAEISKIDKKLGNAKFTERAPAAVVQEQHDRRAAFVEDLEKLKQARAALG